MTGAGTVQTGSASDFETLYAGYRWDGESPQLYYVRNRFLLPVIGIWNRRDPLGYTDSTTQYGYCDSNPVGVRDPSGLFSAPKAGQTPMIGAGAERRPTPTCIFLLGKVNFVRNPKDPEQETDYERWLNDAKRYQNEVNSAAKIFHSVTAANIAATIRQGKCCSIITIGHKGGPKVPGQTGADGKPIFPDPVVESEIGAAFAGNGCSSCEIDVMGCQYRGVNREPERQPIFTNHYPECLDPDVLNSTCSNAANVEQKTWQEASVRTGCNIKSSVHILSVNIIHTCVPSGVYPNLNKGESGPVLTYPEREEFCNGVHTRTLPARFPKRK